VQVDFRCSARIQVKTRHLRKPLATVTTPSTGSRISTALTTACVPKKACASTSSLLMFEVLVLFWKWNEAPVDAVAQCDELPVVDEQHLRAPSQKQKRRLIISAD
jgi:hypothetical protein